MFGKLQGRNHWGEGWGGPDPPPQKKKWMDHSNFFDEECDYRYVIACSAWNWVYHPYFVLYSKLHQGIRPPQLWKRGCAPGTFNNRVISGRVMGRKFRPAVARLDRKRWSHSAKWFVLLSKRYAVSGRLEAVSYTHLTLPTILRV